MRSLFFNKIWEKYFYLSFKYLIYDVFRGYFLNNITEIT